MLDEERQFYRSKHDELRAAHFGQFVLVKGSSLIGVFNTHDEAVAEGAKQFGLQPFLVRQVDSRDEREVAIPALALGLLRADP